MKTLQQWYNENQISYSDKQTLNKMGVGDYDYHNLQDLKQMVSCEYWAKSSSIRNEITNPIRRISFFTPDFNDSKPDASNYSCALVQDSSFQDWVIIYRPSYTNDDFIYSDVIVKRIYDIGETERDLSSYHPISAVAPNYGSFNDFVTWPYVVVKDLPSDGKYNPDKYILPLDIVKINRGSYSHFAVYLGNKQVCNYLNSGTSFDFDSGGTQFDTWNKLVGLDDYSTNYAAYVAGGAAATGMGGVFALSSAVASSPSWGTSGGVITIYHPRIPFKRKSEIIRHMAKAIDTQYGKKTWDNIVFPYFNSLVPTEKKNYNWSVRNCEHLTNRLVLGINISTQVDSSRNFNLRSEVFNSGTSSQAPSFDDLTSSDCSYEKNKINNYIQQAESNRTYTRPKYQIEQEKFTARIEVRPNPPCKIQ